MSRSASSDSCPGLCDSSDSSEFLRLCAEVQREDEEKASAEAAALHEDDEDHAAALVEEMGYSESVDAVDRAVVILSKWTYDRPAAAASLLQLIESGHLPKEAMDIATIFLDAGFALGGVDHKAPEANAYELQSIGNAVELLKRLRDGLRGKLDVHGHDTIVELGDSGISERRARSAGERSSEGRARSSGDS